VGHEFEPRVFHVFGAVAIAVIGKLPDTLSRHTPPSRDTPPRLISAPATGWWRPSGQPLSPVLDRDAAFTPRKICAVCLAGVLGRQSFRLSGVRP
jgi:hypothetical protein